jgi:hypothetical protein
MKAWWAKRNAGKIKITKPLYVPHRTPESIEAQKQTMLHRTPEEVAAWAAKRRATIAAKKASDGA